MRNAHSIFLKIETELRLRTDFQLKILFYLIKENVSINKNIGDLNKFIYLNCVVFVNIKNKWSEIDTYCCKNKCINTNKPIGNCIEGNGFGNIINDEDIKYLVGCKLSEIF